MAVISLSDLKTQMGISGSSYDTQLTNVVNSVNDYIDRVTGTYWGESVTITDEVHDYAPIIFLDKRNVTAVDAVKVEGTTIDSSEYRWSATGRLVLTHDIRRQTTTYDYDDVKITYDAGNLTVPDDLKQAALLMGQLLYSMRETSGRAITREKVGSREIEYSDSMVSVFDIIDGYKAL